MIPNEIVAKVYEFARRRPRLSCRKIAALVGIGRSSVQNLIRGRKTKRKRPNLAPDDPKRERYPVLRNRCPGCGAKVYVWPCIACSGGIPDL